MHHYVTNIDLTNYFLSLILKYIKEKYSRNVSVISGLFDAVEISIEILKICKNIKLL